MLEKEKGFKTYTIWKQHFPAKALLLPTSLRITLHFSFQLDAENETI
jgi:hypothetical protein